jgi:molecular chaperone GrpE
MPRKRIKPKRPDNEAPGAVEAPAGPEAPEVAEGLAEIEAARDALVGELAEERKRSEELHEQYLRALAELDNFRKRTRSEIDAQRRQAAQDVIVSVLSVADNLGRAVEAAEKGEDSGALLEGVKLTLKQCHEALAGFGVEPIEALGCEFDPTVHEAVMQVPASEADDGKVVGETQRGYKMGDRVIRPALVQVGKGPVEVEGKPAEG